MTKTPIIFFGSEKSSLIILEKLFSISFIKINLIITRPSSKIIIQYAQKHQIPLLAPAKLNEKIVQIITEEQPLLGILASYGQIIPGKLIRVFPHGIINIHPSLLPQLRGPSPIENTILSGLKKSGVSIMLLDDKTDHGPIIIQKKVVIKPDANQKKLTQKLFQLGADLLVKYLKKYLKGEIKLSPQDHSKATFTKKLQRQDGYIKFSQLKKAIYKGGQTAIEVEQKIRAFLPWPGVYSFFPNIKKKSPQEKQRVKILKASLNNQKQLILQKVQFAGRQSIKWNKNLQKIYFSQ